ncbi:calcium-binding protein [Dryocola clanedunensis]
MEEGIEYVEFADGTLWDQSTINDRIQPVQHLLASSPSLLPASDGRLDTVPAGFTAPIQGALWG